MQESSQGGGGVPTGVVEEPQGVPQAAVDDKGRLKLPVEFVKYVESFGGRKVFITTFDKRQGRIYPMSVWQSNLEALRKSPDKKMAQRRQFEAKVYGDAVEIDEANRVLLPVEMRKLLGVTNKQPVWLDAFNGRVTVVTKQVFDERMKESESHMAGDLDALDELEGFR